MCTKLPALITLLASLCDMTAPSACSGFMAALCGNYQLLVSMLKWQNDTQMFLKLTDMTHGTIYCPITLKLRDKTPLRAALSGDAIVHCIQWLF